MINNNDKFVLFVELCTLALSLAFLILNFVHYSFSKKKKRLFYVLRGGQVRFIFLMGIVLIGISSLIDIMFKIDILSDVLSLFYFSIISIDGILQRRKELK